MKPREAGLGDRHIGSLVSSSVYLVADANVFLLKAKDESATIGARVALSGGSYSRTRVSRSLETSCPNPVISGLGMDHSCKSRLEDWCSRVKMNQRISARSRFCQSGGGNVSIPRHCCTMLLITVVIHSPENDFSVLAAAPIAVVDRCGECTSAFGETVHYLCGQITSKFEFHHCESAIVRVGWN